MSGRAAGGRRAVCAAGRTTPGTGTPDRDPAGRQAMDSVPLGDMSAVSRGALHFHVETKAATRGQSARAGLDAVAVDAVLHGIPATVGPHRPIPSGRITPSADPAAAAAKNAGRRGCPAGCDAAARPAGGSVPSGPAAGCVDGAAEDDRRLPTVTGWRRPSSAEPPWTGGCRIDAGGSAHGCRADRGRAGLISASRGEPAENATPASGTPADRRSRHSVKPAWPPSGHGRRAATVTRPGARAPGRRPT